MTNYRIKLEPGGTTAETVTDKPVLCSRQGLEPSDKCDECGKTLAKAGQLTHCDEGWFCSEGCWERFIEGNHVNSSRQ